MELLEGMKTRKSWRAFKATPIPEEMLRKVFQVAGNSPSYTNTQPWEVAVVTGKRKEELSKLLYNLSDSATPTNPDFPPAGNWPPELEKRGREHGAKRFEAAGVARDNQQQRKKFGLRNFEFYGAPCAIFLFLDRALGQWSVFDTGLFAQNLILSAHSFGLGSCLQVALVGYPDAVRQYLEIPKSKRLLIGISIGYPDPEAKINTYRAEKIGLDAFVQWYS